MNDGHKNIHFKLFKIKVFKMKVKAINNHFKIHNTKLIIFVLNYSLIIMLLVLIQQLFHELHILFFNKSNFY